MTDTNPVGTKAQRKAARKAWTPPTGSPFTREAAHFRNALDGLDIAQEMAEALVTHYFDGSTACTCGATWQEGVPASHMDYCPVAKWDKWQGAE